MMIYDRYESDGWVGGVLYPFFWFFFVTGWWASVAFLLLGPCFSGWFVFLSPFIYERLLIISLAEREKNEYG